MLNRPTELSQTDAQTQTLSKVTPKSKSQHGINQISYPILVDVPVETLTGITSHLDPPTLFALAQVNTHLNRHIKDDNTWRRAFVQQFLGIGPEGNLDDEKVLLLRRNERSWRQEFIAHYVLIRRWERSRNVTTAHVPVHSTISGMRLMSSNALLTSSITYGIVARSIPLTGKILPGYLDASGLRAGLGIGNPNAEFTPNISSCAISSDGGTAKIVWGSRAGHLTFMSAPRAMETSRRSAADIKRSLVADEHQGPVLDVQWIDIPNSWVLSGGSDSCVKLWDGKNANCAWTSELNLVTFVPDHCLKVAASIQHGFVVSVHASGDIHLWTGFDFAASTRIFNDVRHVCVKCPLRTTAEGYDAQAVHDIKTLSIDPTRPAPTILVAYQNDPYFYRVSIDPTTGYSDTLPFGDPFFGVTSVVVPFFRSEQRERAQASFVLVGDHLGCVSLYAWDADAARARVPTHAVGPVRKFEAHRDGASVTALAWNGLTLITGSARGTTHVWDALTFAPLRAFGTPVPRLRGRALHPGVDLAERESVRHILISAEKDVMVVAVGDHVMTWRAGPVAKNGTGGVRGRHAGGALGKKRSSNTKYMGQLELKQTIQESRSLLKEESKYSHKSLNREREHRARLDNLGLSEAEAVEYVLMLSRDEAAASASVSASLDAEEGVFEGDFYDDLIDEDDGLSRGSSRRPSTSTASSVIGSAPPRLYPSSSSSSASSGASFHSHSTHSVSSHRSGMTTTRDGRPIPRIAPPAPGTHEKIRVSPPYRAEVIEAGAEYVAEDGPPEGTRMHISDHFFPPIASASTSPTGSSGIGPAVGAGVDAGSGSAHSNLHSHRAKTAKNAKTPSPPSVSPLPTPSGSPRSLRSQSAWSVPLRAPGASGTGSPRNAWAGPSRTQVSNSPPTARAGQPRTSSGANALSGSRGTGLAVSALDEMDDDLRFALELSLAEAQSRAEDA